MDSRNFAIIFHAFPQLAYIGQVSYSIKCLLNFLKLAGTTYHVTQSGEERMNILVILVQIFFLVHPHPGGRHYLLEVAGGKRYLVENGSNNNLVQNRGKVHSKFSFEMLLSLR